MTLTEFTVEDATVEWFTELSYAIRHRPHIANGEPAVERDSFGEVLLAVRLREAIRRLSPAASISANMIKADEKVGGSRKYARYLPFWA